ncbi:hypothetical protein NE237_018557 [Protea cynaroides]|uniref:Uncharacterized protein n=1 Tax=Protea cynaroides TaxID=273540 RepID=A0A9Q0KA44_9MAGN|nr:hypothetical protein NE237_018557 [Protea cynaroides]
MFSSWVSWCSSLHPQASHNFKIQLVSNNRSEVKSGEKKGKGVIFEKNEERSAFNFVAEVKEGNSERLLEAERLKIRGVLIFESRDGLTPAPGRAVAVSSFLNFPVKD